MLHDVSNKRTHTLRGVCNKKDKKNKDMQLTKTYLQYKKLDSKFFMAIQCLSSLQIWVLY